MIKKAIIIALLSAQIGYAAESKLLNYIGSLLPNLTEIGYVTNVVNVYFQVSNFLRTTNKLVHNIKAAKQEWQLMKEKMVKLYADVQSLGNIDPYNMDTWQNSADFGQFVFKYELADVEHTWGMVEFYSIDATREYVNEITSPADYNRLLQKAKDNATVFSAQRNQTTAEGQFVNSYKQYEATTLSYLRARLASMEAAYGSIDQMQEPYKSEAISLQEDINRITAQFEHNLWDRTKIDSITSSAQDLIAVNLTEMQVLQTRIKSMETAAGELVEAYKKVTNNEVSTTSSSPDGSAPAVQDAPVDTGEHYDPVDADKVPAPVKPAEASGETTQKRKTTQQDIIALQSSIKLLIYKQECAVRDLTAMKVNTMAFMVGLEGHKQWETEMQSINMAVSASMMTTATQRVGQ